MHQHPLALLRLGGTLSTGGCKAAVAALRLGTGAGLHGGLAPLRALIPWGCLCWGKSTKKAFEGQINGL